MTDIQESARGQFGQNVTRKRPSSDYNSAGQQEFDYSSTTDSTVNVVLVKNYLNNEQEREGIKQNFPAKIFGATDLDVKDYDLIVTATETFQVLNAQIKANNITGSASTIPSYFYANLTYFDHDDTLE